MARIYKSDADKAVLYNSMVNRAENKLQEEKGKRSLAPSLVRRYRNEVTADEFSVGGQRITVPAGISVIDSLYAALTSVSIEFGVKNLAHGTREQADVAQKGIGEVWRESKGQRKFNRAVKDSVLVGIGWLKVGYDYQARIEDEPRPEEDIRADMDDIILGSRAEGIEPPDPKTLASLVETMQEVEVIERDRIVLDYVPYEDVYYDPDAKNSDEIRWICQEIRLPIEEVRQNPMYREYVAAHADIRDLDELGGDIRHDYSDDASNYFGIGTTDVFEEKVTLREFWNFETGTFCIFAKDQGFLLYEDTNPLGFNDDLEDRNPFVPIILRSDPEQVWGIGDMQIIIPLLDELNHARSMRANYLERLVPKVAGPSDAMDEATQTAFESKEPGVFVPLANGHPFNDIGTLDPPNLPQEVFGVTSDIMEDMREATGLNEILRGLFSQGRKTATETSEVVAASSSRQSEKRNGLEQAYIDVARRFLQFMQLFYDDTRVSRIVRKEETELWSWDKEDITMEADLEISLYPKETPTPDSRLEKALALINLLGPLPETNRRNLIFYVLKEMGYDDDVIQDVIASEEEEMETAGREAEKGAMEQSASAVASDPAMLEAMAADPELQAQAAAASGGAVPGSGPPAVV